MNPHDRRVHSEDESWPCAIATFIPSLAAMTAPSSEPLLRPFRFSASDAALADLRRRAAGTKSPEHETTVADATQGARLATVQKLPRYWATGYDRRKADVRQNRS